MASGTREHPLSLVQFPFSAGIDESTRDEVVEAGAGWAVLENGRQDQRGGYSTRSGFDPLSQSRFDATASTAGYKMFAHRDETVRITDTLQAESYSTKALVWSLLGRVPECMARIIEMPTMGTSGTIEDVDITNGYIATTWLNQDGGTFTAFAAVTEQATGVTVRAPEQIGGVLDTGENPLLLAVQGNYFIVVRYRATGTKMLAYYLDTTSAATIEAGWIAFASPLATDAVGGSYAVHSLPHASTPRVALLYQNAGGVATDLLTLLTFDTSGVVQTRTILTDSVAVQAVALGGFSTDTLWLAWDEGVGVYVQGVEPFTISSDLATRYNIIVVSTGVDLVYIAGSTTTGHARVWSGDQNATLQSFMSGVITTGGGAASGDGAGIWTVAAVKMVRKPFCLAGRFYSGFYAADQANVQNNFFVCDWTEPQSFLRPIANPAPSLSGAGLYCMGKFAMSATGTTFFGGFNLKRSAIADGTALVELDFANSRRWQITSHGEATFLTGGIPSYYDGVRVAEVGFLYRPTAPSTTTSGTGITAATGWRYIAVYEETDAEGNWCVSGLSDPSSSTGAVANKTVNVKTVPLSITSRTSSNAIARGTRAAIYRTLDGGVAPYYRVGTVLNDFTATTLTYHDTMSDATLATKSKLYSQPGVPGTAQDRRPPPPFSSLVSYNGMLVGASGSDVWFSGQNVSGEATWFNPIFQIPIPGNGDITALWVQDGTLFVAKRREIYAMAGEPPEDNGVGGLGVPRRLAVDVGCIESRSPVTTAYGTFFQSDRGIEILTRSQTVEWIGESIQNTLASYPIVTSATVDPGSCTVLIECASAESGGLVTGTGTSLIYDLSLKTWVSTDLRKSSSGVAATPSQSACMIYTGSAYRYAWLDAAGTVYTETTSHLDADGSMVCKRAVSANVKTSGLQGLQHINRTLLLARYHTAHDLDLSFAYNYSSTYETARTYTAEQIATLVEVLPNMQIEHPMHDDARCEAVRVQLQDVTPSQGDLGTGQGATWIALAFEVVPMAGAYTLPDVSR